MKFNFRSLYTDVTRDHNLKKKITSTGQRINNQLFQRKETREKAGQGGGNVRAGGG